MQLSPGKGTINLDNISSVGHVLSELKRLNQVLPNSELNNLQVFNGAYIVVTNQVNTALNDGYYSEPIFVEEFVVTFAKYYFKALNDFCDYGAMPEVWQKVAQSPKPSKSPAFISLLLGANAHINHDLPLALAETMDKFKGIADTYILNILKTDKILMKSSHEILDSFDENSRIFNFIKKRLEFVYRMPTMYLILHWRKGAWNSYKQYANSQTGPSNFANRSNRIANRLNFWRSRLSSA